MAKQTSGTASNARGHSPPQLSARPEITRCPSPAISVVIPESDLASAPDSQAVLDWAAGQTLKSVEVVQWDRMAGIAAVLSSGDESNTPRSWGAGSVKQLCQGLLGRYLCMASADLLQHNTTYLETKSGRAWRVKGWFSPSIRWEARMDRSRH